MISSQKLKISSLENKVEELEQTLEEVNNEKKEMKVRTELNEGLKVKTDNIAGSGKNGQASHLSCKPVL